MNVFQKDQLTCIISLTASQASSLLLATITPFPAASPLAFTTKAGKSALWRQRKFPYSVNPYDSKVQNTFRFCDDMLQQQLKSRKKKKYSQHHFHVLHMSGFFSFVFLCSYLWSYGTYDFPFLTYSESLSANLWWKKQQQYSMHKEWSLRYKVVKHRGI